LKGSKNRRAKRELKRTESKYKDAVISAAQAELLLPDQAGFIETENDMERTFKVTQKQIKDDADINTSKNIFDLSLTQYGPYSIDFTRNGRHAVLGGRAGHLALMDLHTADLLCEVNVHQTVRAVCFLHQEGLFAAAQKRCAYIYTAEGAEAHQLREHEAPEAMAFLPFHFLLATVGAQGKLRYLDVSTGTAVSSHSSKAGPCRVLRQNPHNAVVHLGQGNGVVSLWSPATPNPLVKMLCHTGSVSSLAIRDDGRTMVTAGMDGKIKVWDLRTFKSFRSVSTPAPPVSMDFSQRGLLAANFGARVVVFRADLKRLSTSNPYMEHRLPGKQVRTVRFRPYEDALGVGHSEGFTSVVVPGAGEANFDSFAANPFQTTKQKREAEVQALLDKLQPDMIGLDPDVIGTVDRNHIELAKEQKQIAESADRRPEKEKKLRNKMRGRSKMAAKMKEKQKNVIDEQTTKLKEKMEQEKENKKQEYEARKKEKIAKEVPSALHRFI